MYIYMCVCETNSKGLTAQNWRKMWFTKLQLESPTLLATYMHYKWFFNEFKNLCANSIYQIGFFLMAEWNRWKVPQTIESRKIKWERTVHNIIELTREMPVAIINMMMKSCQDRHFNICGYACIILWKINIKEKLISWVNW